MPRSSIQLGFHRLGIALGGILAVIVGGFGLAVAVTQRVDERLPIAIASAFVLAALVYGLCRLTGWVVEGFMGGGRPIASAASRSSEPGAFRRWIVIALEGALLTIVVGTAIYYAMAAADPAHSLNERMLGGWIAALLCGLTFSAPIRRRVEKRGTQAALDYGFLLEGGIAMMIMLTIIGIGMGVKRYGDFTLMWPVWLFAGMFFWPEVRHRILRGEWRRG